MDLFSNFAISIKNKIKKIKKLQKSLRNVTTFILVLCLRVSVTANKTKTVSIDAASDLSPKIDIFPSNIPKNTLSEALFSLTTPPHKFGSLDYIETDYFDSFKSLNCTFFFLNLFVSEAS